MTEPDENPAIAGLLDEAAELAAAANARLGEALAIAEQTRRDAAFNEDRRFFRDNPDRSFRARLATAQEVDDLHSSGAWPPGWAIDPTCFVWTIAKIDCERLCLEALYFILPPPKREPREDELERTWDNAQTRRVG